jgi:hypothetical protein
MRITLLLLLIPVIARAAPLVLETPHFTLTADAATGRVELHDRAGGITWKPANGQTHHLASLHSLDHPPLSWIGRVHVRSG